MEWRLANLAKVSSHMFVGTAASHKPVSHYLIVVTSRQNLTICDPKYGFITKMNKPSASFSFLDAVNVVSEGLSYDLHNFGVFKSIRFAPDERVIELQFLGLCNETKEKIQISLLFRDVFFVGSSDPLFDDSPIGVSELGYKEPTDLDLDFLRYDPKLLSEYHYFIRFDFDRYLRIGARRTEFRAHPSHHLA